MNVIDINETKVNSYFFQNQYFNSAKQKENFLAKMEASKTFVRFFWIIPKSNRVFKIFLAILL